MRLANTLKTAWYILFLALLSLFLTNTSFADESAQHLSKQAMVIEATDGEAFFQLMQNPTFTQPLPGSPAPSLEIAGLANSASLIRPSSMADETGPTRLPSGQNVIKIEVNEKGMYELTYADLQAAGLDVDALDPNTFEMLHRAETVSYELISDGDSQFEAGESVIFYGWEFDGTNFEKEYVDNNVFWLWADGAPSTVSTTSNTPGLQPLTEFPNTIVREPELIWSATNSDNWDNFVNDPDTWHWAYLNKRGADPLTLPLTVDIVNLAVGSSSEASYVVEAMSRTNYNNHLVEVSVNGYTPASITWNGLRSVDVFQTVPSSALVPNRNTFDITLATPNSADRLMINSIQVTYPQTLQAIDDMLVFGTYLAGGFEFQVGNFTTNDSNQIRVWDITDRNNPIAIDMPASQIVANNSTYTYNVGTNAVSGAEYVATTLDATKRPLSMSSYFSPDLEPPSSSAEWVAVTHSSMQAQADRLAAHRSTISGMTSHVVDVEDVINQYGYGLATPDAIRNYMVHGYNDWTIAPKYLTLFGTGSVNPRNVDCTDVICGTTTVWDEEVNLIPTYLAFEDRSIGLIPSDYPFTLLTGDDLIPEIAVGRITAETAQEAENVVDKILQHEANLQNQAPYTENITFIGDNADDGGNFCANNENVAATLPSNYDVSTYCLDVYLDRGDGIEEMSGEFFQDINANGALVVNYRGHGSIIDWGGGIMSISDAARWQNAGLAGIILSADCLDGNFAWIDVESLSETILTIGGKRGSAAHWSASGLGYTSEHSVLHQGFYDGIFEEGFNRIGDAINYSKINYYNAGQHESELYAFILQGDPAMPLIRVPGESGAIAGPIANASTNNAYVLPATTYTYDVYVANYGTATDSFTLSLEGNEWPATLSTNQVGPLEPGQGTYVTVTVTVPPDTPLLEEDIVTLLAQSNFDPASDVELEMTTTAWNSIISAVTLSDMTTSQSQTTIIVVMASFMFFALATVAMKRKARHIRVAEHVSK